MGRQLVDHLVHGRAGLDHDENGAGLGDARDKVGEVAGREEPALAAMLRHELVRPFMVAVEEGDAKSVPRGVAREVGAHDGQSHDADVSLLSHVSRLAS